jgi:hypothetical protein
LFLLTSQFDLLQWVDNSAFRELVHTVRSNKLSFYGCKARSLLLREEHRLKLFVNRVFRRIFGAKRDEITGGWRKLHNEDFFLFGATAPIWALAYFHETLRFNSVF